MVVAFAGVVAIGVSTSTGKVDALGVGLGLLAAALYAGCTLLQKRTIGGVDVITYTWLAALAGTLVLVPFAPGFVGEASRAPVAATLGVVYLGVVPTAIAFLTWGYALKRLSAGSTSATTYVVPALAVLMSWAILGEVPGPVTLLGGVLCLAGVALTRMRWRASGPGA